MGEVFFIVGRGRSGTTLLSRMLLRHSRIVVAPEGFFAMSLERRYGAGAWDEARVDAFLRDLVLENRMRTWNLDLTALRSVLVSRLNTLRYAEVCRLVYAAAAERLGRTDAGWLGDKNPHYALLTSRIAACFPAARFVHIVRDPRDNICSYRTVPFDVGNVGALAYRWRRYNEEILATARAFPDRFLRLRYEDLIADPRRELGRICAFLDLAFEDAMLAFHEADTEGFYGERSRWFANLKKPLDAARAERWRTDLPEASVRLADAICGPLAAELGYAVDEPNTRATHVTRWIGQGFGWGSVLAEKFVFDALPVQLRSRLINAYRRSSGRI
jgi:hypothetical protein